MLLYPRGIEYNYYSKALQCVENNFENVFHLRDEKKKRKKTTR